MILAPITPLEQNFHHLIQFSTQLNQYFLKFIYPAFLGNSFILYISTLNLYFDLIVAPLTPIIPIPPLLDKLYHFKVIIFEDSNLQPSININFHYLSIYSLLFYC